MSTDETPSITEPKRLYRSNDGGVTLALVTEISDNVTTIYTDNIADSALGGPPPTVNDTAAHDGTVSYPTEVSNKPSIKLDGTVAAWDLPTNSYIIASKSLTRPFIRVPHTRAPLIIDPQGPTIVQQGFTIAQVLLATKIAPQLAGFQVKITAFDPSDVQKFTGTIPIPVGTKRVADIVTLNGQNLVAGDRIEFQITPGFIGYIFAIDQVDGTVYVYDKNLKLVQSFTMLTAGLTSTDFDGLDYDGESFYALQGENADPTTVVKFDYDFLTNTPTNQTNITYPTSTLLAGAGSFPSGLAIYQGAAYIPVRLASAGYSKIVKVSLDGTTILAQSAVLPMAFGDILVHDSKLYLFGQSRVMGMDPLTLKLIGPSFAAIDGEGLAFDGHVFYAGNQAGPSGFGVYGTYGGLVQTLTTNPPLLAPALISDMVFVGYNDIPLNVTIL